MKHDRDTYLNELWEYYTESDSAFGITSNFAAMKRIMETGYSSESWENPFTDGKIFRVKAHRKTRQALANLSSLSLTTFHHYFTEGDPGRQIRIYANEYANLITAHYGKPQIITWLVKNQLKELTKALEFVKHQFQDALNEYQQERQKQDQQRKKEKHDRQTAQTIRPRKWSILDRDRWSDD